MNKLTYLPVLLLLLLPGLLLADLQLPPEAMDANTYELIVVDLNRTSAQQFSLAAQAILGDKSDLAKPVARYFDHLQPLRDAGAVLLVQGLMRYKSDEIIPLFIFKISPGREKEANQAVSRMFGGFIPTPSKDNWIVYKWKSKPATRPVTPAGENSLLRKALAITGEHACVSLNLPDDQQRKSIASEFSAAPAQLRQLIVASQDAQYQVLAVDLGEKPALYYYALMPDEASAARLMTAARDLSQSSDAQLVPFKPLLTALTPQQKGLMVTLEVNTPQLASIGQALAPMLEAYVTAQEQANKQQEIPTVIPDSGRQAAAAHMRLILAQLATFDRQNGRLPQDLDELMRSGFAPDTGI